MNGNRTSDPDQSGGQMALDFLIGFTIFTITFIVVMTLNAGILTNLQGRTIDQDSIAYRTGVVLTEDTGVVYPNEPAWQAYVTTSLAANRTGLRGASTAGRPNIFFNVNQTSGTTPDSRKYSPLVLDSEKIVIVNNKSMISDSNLSSTVFFTGPSTDVKQWATYGYNYNITLRIIGDINPILTRGIPVPHYSSTGYIKRIVLVSSSRTSDITLSGNPPFNSNSKIYPIMKIPCNRTGIGNSKEIVLNLNFTRWPFNNTNNGQDATWPIQFSMPIETYLTSDIKFYDSLFEFSNVTQTRKIVNLSITNTAWNGSAWNNISIKNSSSGYTDWTWSLNNALFYDDISNPTDMPFPLLFFDYSSPILINNHSAVLISNYSYDLTANSILNITFDFDDNVVANYELFSANPTESADSLMLPTSDTLISSDTISQIYYKPAILEVRTW